jgi:hypothetical protein
MIIHLCGKNSPVIIIGMAMNTPALDARCARGSNPDSVEVGWPDVPRDYL